MIFRSLALIFTLALLSLTSCNKDEQETSETAIQDSSEQYESTGTITGFDASMGPCGGGLMINIDGIENSDFRIYELPEDSDIDFSTLGLPVNVNLNYTGPDNDCTRYITIEAIEII